MPHVEYIFAIHSPRGDKDDHKVANLEYVNYISYGISILLWYDVGGWNPSHPPAKNVYIEMLGKALQFSTKIPS